MLPRFVADSMLGRLAKWLRAFGFDVVHHPFAGDHNLIARARERDAMVLTQLAGPSHRGSHQGTHRGSP